MSAYAIDHQQWLVTTLRQLEAYTLASLQALPELGSEVTVEMDFPDTRSWKKETPLDHVLVHFSLDDENDPALGFGKPGASDYDSDAGTELFSEAAMHLLNFDVGIWVSAESGGASKRMETRQALKNLFGTVTGKQAFNEALDGPWVVSFDGGSDELDRINDIPVWRTAGMTLVVRVFSKHTPAQPTQVPLSLDQLQELTIQGEDGEPEHIWTTEEAWS